MHKIVKSVFKVAIIALIICVLFVRYNAFNTKETRPILPDDQFAFSPTPQDWQIGGFDGIYYRKESNLMEVFGCKIDGWEDCTSYTLLRFYDDGVVLSVSIGTDDGIQSQDLPKLAKWFNQDAEDISRGQYFISGKKIWFGTTAYYDADDYLNNNSDNNDDWHVTVDYSGMVFGNTILLNSYSHFNGFSRSNQVYSKLNEEK